MSVHIKTDDLCDRCVFAACNTALCATDNGCPQNSVFGCRCLWVEQNTPCPYFTEARQGMKGDVR